MCGGYSSILVPVRVDTDIELLTVGVVLKFGLINSVFPIIS